MGNVHELIGYCLLEMPFFLSKGFTFFLLVFPKVVVFLDKEIYLSQG